MATLSPRSTQVCHLEATDAQSGSWSGGQKSVDFSLLLGLHLLFNQGNRVPSRLPYILPSSTLPFS